MALRGTMDFMKTEAGGAAALGVGALAALVLANSPYAHLYFGLLDAPFSIRIGAYAETLSLRDWVQDGLMGVFFFVLGLEVKQEVLKGELSSPRKLALPVGAAIGGLIVPALVYLAFNLRGGGAPHGWPVGAASDIAFALGALALAGRNLPEALRLFLLTLALAGAVAAVVLIGALFTGPVHPWALVGAALTLAALIGLSEWKEAPFLFRVIGFFTLGAFTLKSGVNTALAAVAAALTVPIGPRRPDQDGVLKHFMESVHPYVAFAILPLFGFTVAGLRLADLPLAALASPITLGAAAGLFLGKPAGVMGVSWLMVRTGLARRPTGAGWLELWGVALLCGVGFSMSLYIGALAFPDAMGLQRGELTLGVLVGSLASGLAGMAVLAVAARRREAARAARD
ncbi:MAG: Na+/H+ antiporter NhaA [Caulobacteraceae bacterium]|nr:Na+/H+ antiporter NhaA [Caulobacteraceae bacterium]